MLKTDKYGDPILEPTAADLLHAPTTPQIDRIRPHLTTAVSTGEDAEIVCVPECPACADLYTLDGFWHEVGGYPDDGLWLA